MTFLDIIFWLLLIDSLGAMWVAWFGQKWYLHHLRIFVRYFPPAKGWAAYYFILVLFIGYIVGIFS